MRALAEADFVISVVPANDNTKHLFNEQKFQKMKSTSYFINVGRGAVVDEQALLDALKSQEVCSAFFLVAARIVANPFLWKSNPCCRLQALGWMYLRLNHCQLAILCGNCPML